MSYREWGHDARDARVPPRGGEWLASDDTYAGQPERDSFGGRSPGDLDTRGDDRQWAGGPPAPTPGRPGRHARPAGEDSWPTGRADDTGSWTRAAHTGEWQQGPWPARRFRGGGRGRDDGRAGPAGPDQGSDSGVDPPRGYAAGAWTERTRHSWSDDAGRTWSQSVERSWSAHADAGWTTGHVPSQARPDDAGPRAYGRGGYSYDHGEPYRSGTAQPAPYWTDPDDRPAAGGRFRSLPGPDDATREHPAYRDTGYHPRELDDPDSDAWTSGAHGAGRHHPDPDRGRAPRPDWAAGPGPRHAELDPRDVSRPPPAFGDPRYADAEPHRPRRPGPGPRYADPEPGYGDAGWRGGGVHPAGASAHAAEYRDAADRYADPPVRAAVGADDDRHLARLVAGAGRPVSGGRLVAAVTGAERGPGPGPKRRSGAADEELDTEPGGYLAATLYTVMWYAVPMVLWVVYGLTLNREAVATSCTDELLPCEPPSDGALDHVWEKLPVLGVTLGISVLIALLLRRLSGTWKAATVGFAAAAVGGGLATVGFSVITGQPLG